MHFLTEAKIDCWLSNGISSPEVIAIHGTGEETIRQLITSGRLPGRSIPYETDRTPYRKGDFFLYPKVFSLDENHPLRQAFDLSFRYEEEWNQDILQRATVHAAENAGEYFIMNKLHLDPTDHRNHELAESLHYQDKEIEIQTSNIFDVLARRDRRLAFAYKYTPMRFFINRIINDAKTKRGFLIGLNPYIFERYNVARGYEGHDLVAYTGEDGVTADMVSALMPLGSSEYNFLRTIRLTT